ncbi:MAG: pilus assembly protein N-terminal domain-containing protein [Verrucomicrobia bacterium]|nr:pilus assembly protein N-terminal domain-containing protein [Verrucomicrobiota bacterium]
MSFITRMFAPVFAAGAMSGRARQTAVLAAAAIFAASLGMAAEPLAQTNAPTAGRGRRLVASGTNVIIIASSPVVQSNVPAISKAPAPPPVSSNIVVATSPVAKTDAPAVGKAPAPAVPGTNVVAAAKAPAQTNAPTVAVSPRLPASTFGVVAASSPHMQTNTLTIGEARLLPATGSNVIVPIEGVIRVVPAGPGKVVVSAEQEGHTDMMVLDDDSKITEHYTILVTKKQHVAEKQTYEGSLEDFRQVVTKMVGDHQVQFDMVVGPRISFNGTNLVSQPHPVLFIHGEAKDEIEANTIRNIASRFYGRGDFGSTSQQVTPTASYDGAPATTNTVQLTSLNNDPNIVDQITIRTHHQVRIRVQVAEVSIAAAKNKGIRYSDNITGRLSVTGGLTPAMEVYPGNPSPTASLTVSEVTATLHLLVRDNLARILSEPTLVTKSGQDASFLAGGQIIQQVMLNNSLSQMTTPYGVRMTIKPTVDRADHIDIEIYTEVSEEPLMLSTGEYKIESRNSATKLRLNNHDTLIMGGLLKNKFSNDMHKVPWLGQVPVLGALFRSKEWLNGQSELLFFITPEIIGEDLKADTERNVTTPAMKQWHKVDSHKDILPDPNSHAGPDNDVHDLLGLPVDRMHNEELKLAPAVPDTAPARGASR